MGSLYGFSNGKNPVWPRLWLGRWTMVPKALRYSVYLYGAMVLFLLIRCPQLGMGYSSLGRLLGDRGPPGSLPCVPPQPIRTCLLGSKVTEPTAGDEHCVNSVWGSICQIPLMKSLTSSKNPVFACSATDTFLCPKPHCPAPKATGCPLFWRGDARSHQSHDHGQDH